ncbi:DRMBL protein [Rhizoctonia solani]|uniref:DRMBL protein n=1 Tax=Rhizoctonia solani TaxID=456999 RepID=A0A8H7LXB5_9AGAM|nr:DRMBL protein [Rhizoctonia solani]
MSTPEVSQKRKQDVAAEESHTLLSFFVSKRLKRDSVVPGPSVTPGTHKTGARKPDVIIISDDEGCIGTSPTEDVLDLSFSDPIDYHDHGIHAIEDDAIEDVDVPESSIAIPSETPRCLGNQLLASSVELGTCRVCGLVLLDSTAKEISDHIDECLAKPPKSLNGGTDCGHSTPIGVNSIACVNKVLSSYDTPHNSNTLDALMISRQEEEAWDAVDTINNTKRNAKANKFVGKAKVSTRTGDNPKKRKPAPFYKVMPGMPIAVDAFCYGKIPEVTAYFLSHAHSDHYTNLSSSWKNGPIYCSCEMDISVDSAGFNRLEAVTTANLIKHMLRVDPKWVNPLPDNQAVEIPDTGGVRVTLIDANHCPGSSLFVFSGRQTIDAGDSPIKSPFVGSDRHFTYLHCGDFRACPAHALHPAIHGQKLDTVYLDTTYLNPKLAKRYIQEDKAVQTKNGKQKSLPALLINPAGKGGWFKPSPKMLAQTQSKALANTSPAGASGELGRGVLVVVGTYTIGKERIVKARGLYVPSRSNFAWDAHQGPAAAQVHVLPLGQITIESLSEYLVLNQAQYDRILGFRPTGWTYTPPVGQNMAPTIDQILSQAQAHEYTASDLRPQRGSNPRVTVYGVPYSEHSSFRN